VVYTQGGVHTSGWCIPRCITQVMRGIP